MKRVFIAINLPEEVKKELEGLERKITAMFPEEAGRGIIKWVRKDNLHLTLLFVGSVKDEEIPRICEIIKEAVQGWKPFSLTLERVCYGPPNKMPPRLIWVELEKSKDAECLVKILKQKMSEQGVLRKIENRPFTSHITLGRIRAWQWRAIAPEERPEIEKEVALQFNVSSVEVMESKLKRTGAEYTILKSISFV